MARRPENRAGRCKREGTFNAGRAFIFAAALGLAGAADAMTLTSPQIKPGGKIADEQVFNGWDCKGGNVSPELDWSGAPKGTKSFVVTIFDSDAPTGSGFWHWSVANLPPDTKSLPKGAGDGKGLPEGCAAGAQRLQPGRIRRSLPAAR